MWQIYGIMALDIINERQREAAARRRANGPQRPAQPQLARTRARSAGLLTKVVRSTHRA
jgi:hypothetical protein